MFDRIWRGLTAAAREPLLHFAILGLALVGLYRAVAPAALGREVAVSSSVVHGLREDFRRRNGSPPSPQEEAGLVRRYVDNEILYREALALGLERGDVIVRRRLIQKMEFLAEQLAALPEPTQAQLADFLQQHADTYAIPTRISFVHVFAQNNGDPAAALARARSLRQALVTAAAPPDHLGDPFLRGSELTTVSAADTGAIFGDEFAAALFRLTDDGWSQPLRSAYGYHVVKISARQPGRLPDLAEVMDTVARDLTTLRQEEATKAELQRLRNRYAIRIEAEPEPGK